MFFTKSFLKGFKFGFVVVGVVDDDDDDDDDDNDNYDVFSRFVGCGVLLFCGISVITGRPKVTGLRQTHNRYD